MHQLRRHAARTHQIGLPPVEIIQIEVPVVNQPPRRPFPHDRYAKEIRFKHPVLPVLKILEVQLYCLDGVAARTHDLDDHVRRSIRESHAMQMPGRPKMRLPLQMDLALKRKRRPRAMEKPSSKTSHWS
jgi:hypothetical protein